jgi:hypothetical protein
MKQAGNGVNDIHNRTQRDIYFTVLLVRYTKIVMMGWKFIDQMETWKDVIILTGKNKKQTKNKKNNTKCHNILNFSLNLSPKEERFIPIYQRI